ncbi:GGDEF domain-containing protein [Gluconacetobacter takamatsuzukensis]|uniref:diguanylate cyclase n=1 Tax=Gluconacetobacter takamatsuzukensis TaxID=1286190 RepID=A0A7W4KES0_9PROT|nr:diguanylate cyclase [Gluconacetobacter takamatsuzukensis]MBB2205603.1 diguanylate cyclase [Gluconacetobacter takamatsuzukensis]
MPPAPHTPHDAQRLAAVQRVRLLGTPAEERFDRITRLARRMFDVPMAEALSVSERIRRHVADAPIGFDQHQFPVTCSIGLALSTQSDDVDTLTRRADQALYRAKQSGRNRVDLSPRPH